MTRSPVAAVIAVLATLSLAMLVRHCTRPSPPVPAASEQFASRDQGPRRPGLTNRGFADRNQDYGADSVTDPEAAAAGGARARQRVRPAAESAAAGTGIGVPDNQVPGNDAADSPSAIRDKAQQAAQQAAQQSAAEVEQTPGTGDDDPDAPALSLKLDKSSIPEKGETGPVVEQGITFDHQGAYFGEDAVLAMPSTDNVEGTAGTISFWIQPEWAGESDSNAALFQWRTNTFENRIQIFKNGPYLRFLFCDNSGVESGVGYNIVHWKEKEWHAITATWGDGITALYVDGASVGAQEYNGELLIPPGTPWFFGSDHAGGAPGARSRISGFQIFRRSLLPEEIGALTSQTRPAP